MNGRIIKALDRIERAAFNMYEVRKQQRQPKVRRIRERIESERLETRE